MAAKARRKDMSPLDRAIVSRESGIARMRENIKRIKEAADKEIAAIEARIREKSVLLDALKRGQLKAQ